MSAEPTPAPLPVRPRHLLTMLARRAARAILANAWLDGLLRRVLYRFPGLASRLRARLHGTGGGVVGLHARDESALTETAGAVLADLRRAMSPARADRP